MSNWDKAHQKVTFSYTINWCIAVHNLKIRMPKKNLIHNSFMKLSSSSSDDLEFILKFNLERCGQLFDSELAILNSFILIQRLWKHLSTNFSPKWYVRTFGTSCISSISDFYVFNDVKCCLFYKAINIIQIHLINLRPHRKRWTLIKKRYNRFKIPVNRQKLGDSFRSTFCDGDLWANQAQSNLWSK